MRTLATPWRVLAAATIAALTVTACGAAEDGAAEDGAETVEAENVDADAGGDGQAAAPTGSVSLWTHSAGNPAEMVLIEQWVEEYNATLDGSEISIEAFPQIAYNDAVVAAALSGELPCLLDIDGPNVPNWAWAGYLAPLDLPQETLDAFLPTTIGVWDDEVYAIGQFEAAVGMFALASDLDRFGIRVPTLEEPWTGAEFDEVLATYQDSGEFDFALDLGMAWQEEWYPYAFSPFLQSFGGDLIDRDTFLTAEGALNSDEAIAWGEWWQSLFTDGYVPGTSQDAASRETGFVDRQYGLQWNGIWAAGGALEAFGDDMLFLPAPDFGDGPIIGAGSWQWGVSAQCEQPDVAQGFIEYILEPERVAAMADGQSNIPGRADARELTEKFREGGELAVFFELSEAQALIRPPTPAYLNIALIFRRAAGDIANGADVENTLDAAVDEIDADIAGNSGFGHS